LVFKLGCGHLDFGRLPASGEPVKEFPGSSGKISLRLDA
jgi:hypothetical protein